MAVNARRWVLAREYHFGPMHMEEPSPGCVYDGPKYVLERDYQDMWNTAMNRWVTIQRLEGLIEGLEARLCLEVYKCRDGKFMQDCPMHGDEVTEHDASGGSEHG